jgi:hypothetical protein
VAMALPHGEGAGDVLPLIDVAIDNECDRR